MTAANERIYTGGLMRCCLETLQERTEPAEDGERQPCKYCSSSAVFTVEQYRNDPSVRGMWRWDSPFDEREVAQ
ncbi:MAG TPA: hypothetical protein VIV56_14125 [Gemmatimonadales bacterium]